MAPVAAPGRPTLPCMRIPLEPGSGTPVYRQLEAWLRAAIGDGTLEPGARLPSTRALAADLGVARITVGNAYAELERDGLVLGRPGSGTYVAPHLGAGRSPAGSAAVPDLPTWQRRLAQEGLLSPSPASVSPAHPSSLTDPGSDLISFTGVGDLRLVDVGGLSATFRDVLRRDGTVALEYGDLSVGHRPLRVTIAGLLASQGLRVDPDQVLVTSGSQQGLALACQLLTRAGDTVLVEEPTYDRALDLFVRLGLTVVPIPTDEHGMDVERLEPLLRRHRPRLLYTVPNFANPSGLCLSGPRRRRLLELVEEHAVPLVEDDFAGDLRYEGRTQPAIKALDPGGRVIYLGTFSKLLVPGLRLGYVVAEGPVLARLTELKRAHDLTTSPLIQRVVDRFVTVGRYQAHLRRTTRLYRRRRDALVAALTEHLPGARLHPPAGGLFAWLELPDLPDGVTTSSLLPHAHAAGVSFAPGSRFYPDPARGHAHLRLNFAVRTPEEIDEGVRRLALVTPRTQDVPPDVVPDGRRADRSP